MQPRPLGKPNKHSKSSMGHLKTSFPSPVCHLLCPLPDRYVKGWSHSPISNECSSSNATVPQLSPSRPSAPAYREEKGPKYGPLKLWAAQNSLIPGQNSMADWRTSLIVIQLQLLSPGLALINIHVADFHITKENPQTCLTDTLMSKAQVIIFCFLSIGLFSESLTAQLEFMIHCLSVLTLQASTSSIYSPDHSQAFHSWVHRHWLPLHMLIPWPFILSRIPPLSSTS